LIDVMPRPRPPHLHREINRHGTTVWYVRLGKGPRIRVNGVYGSPEFEEQYQAALDQDAPKADAKVSKGTLKWLWMLYRQSSAWTDLALATRRQRENIMRPVIEANGAEPISKLTKRAVEKGVERRKEKPSRAKHFVTSLRTIFVIGIHSRRSAPAQVWRLQKVLIGDCRQTKNRRPREILGRWFLIPGQRRASRLVPANNIRQRMEELRLRDPQLFTKLPRRGRHD
jgi:hypothetical protein